MMVAMAVAACCCSMDEGECGYVSTMGWFWCGNCVAAVVPYCSCNAVTLRPQCRSVAGVSGDLDSQSNCGWMR